MATQPRVTRFKIEWDDKPNGLGESSQSIDNENSGNGIESDGEEPTRPCEPSNNSAITSTNLMMNLNLSNGNVNNNYGREPERISADSTSSLLEPPGPLLTTTLVSGDSDSMNTPMEVI